MTTSKLEKRQSIKKKKAKYTDETKANNQIANKAMTKCTFATVISEIKIIPQWDTLAQHLNWQEHLTLTISRVGENMKQFSLLSLIVHGSINLENTLVMSNKTENAGFLKSSNSIPQYTF